MRSEYLLTFGNLRRDLVYALQVIDYAESPLSSLTDSKEPL